MSNRKKANKRIIRVADILEQISTLNQMIEVHKQVDGNHSMLTQYEYMKDEFVQELSNILMEFKIQLPAA